MLATNLPHPSLGLAAPSHLHGLCGISKQRQGCEEASGAASSRAFSLRVLPMAAG